MSFNRNISSLYKLSINNTFGLYIQQNYKYNFVDQCITVYGYGFYDSDTPETGSHRFYLELDIQDKPKGKILAAIMMNPSNTFPAQNGKPSKIDATVKNVIRMAYRLGKYSKIVILNSFALINGNGENADSDDTQPQNLAIIKSFIQENKEVDYLLAWGDGASDTDEIKGYLRENVSKDRIFAYRKSQQGYPCHPSPIVENPRKYVSEFLNSHAPDSSFEPFNIN